MSKIIGIDLGTTNTCVASVRNKIPKVVPTDRGNLILRELHGVPFLGRPRYTAKVYSFAVYLALCG